MTVEAQDGQAFYNGLVWRGNKMNGLINKYALFDNLESGNYRGLGVLYFFRHTLILPLLSPRTWRDGVREVFVLDEPDALIGIKPPFYFSTGED